MGYRGNACCTAGIAIPGLLVISGVQTNITKALSGFSESATILALVAFIFAAFMQLAGLDRRVALSIMYKLKATKVGKIIWRCFLQTSYWRL